jgi:ELWxxDGT repeat protein
LPVPCVAGSHVVWAARNSSNYEVWSSDGTSPVPTLLLSKPVFNELVSAGSRAWFTAGDAVSGRELWYTDGTPGGTVMIDTIPGPNSTSPGHLCSDGAGGVWFGGNQQSTGTELWHSDGTVAGTAMVADAVPGPTGIDPRNMCSLGSRVFFAASGNGTGEELWVSDGTPAGTRMVHDIAPGTASSSPQELVALPALGKVMFSATDPTAGREPWISDGTAAGTMRLMDVNPGPGDSTDGASMRTARLGGVVWFAATAPAIGRELYRTDGTPAGTSLVADLAPGTVDGDPRPLGDLGTCVLFSVYSTTVGVELWRLAPPATVPTLLVDFDPARPQGSMVSPTRAAALDGRLHFPAFHPAQGTEPYKTDGTTAGTVLIGEVVPGTGGASQLLAATSTHVYYQTADDFLTNTNPRLVAVPANGPPVVLRSGAVIGFAVLRDRLVFAQNGTDSEPMITDGTVAGTSRIAHIRPGTASSQPTPFVTVGDRVYFFADDGVAGRELWVTDGTAAGTTLAVDCVPGPGGLSPSLLIAGQSRMFFRVPGMTWTSDGTPAGTAPLPALPLWGYLTMLGDLLVMSSGRDLWRSDGTAAGSFRILTSDALSSEPIHDLCVARGAAFFSMQRLTTGPQLWRSDGTVAGTVAVAQLHPSPLVAAPHVAPADLAHVACVGTTSAAGAELWISDGTASGTGMVADAEPGPAPSNPQFANGTGTAGRRFIWWSDTVAAGLEPWSIPLAAFGGSAFDRYGLGCAGTRGVPHIQGDGLPILGSPRVAFQLRNALPSTFALLLLGLQRTNSSGACVQLNDGEVLVGLLTDAAGHAEHAFAVPPVAAFVGTAVHGQFVVLDPLGAAFGLAAATAGLEALIGN